MILARVAGIRGKMWRAPGGLGWRGGGRGWVEEGGHTKSSLRTRRATLTVMSPDRHFNKKNFRVWWWWRRKQSTSALSSETFFLVSREDALKISDNSALLIILFHAFPWESFALRRRRATAAGSDTWQLKSASLSCRRMPFESNSSIWMN